MLLILIPDCIAQEGTFLVRLSETSDDAYSISVVYVTSTTPPLPPFTFSPLLLPASFILMTELHEWCLTDKMARSGTSACSTTKADLSLSQFVPCPCVHVVVLHGAMASLTPMPLGMLTPINSKADKPCKSIAALIKEKQGEKIKSKYVLLSLVRSSPQASTPHAPFALSASLVAGNLALHNAFIYPENGQCARTRSHAAPLCPHVGLLAR